MSNNNTLLLDEIRNDIDILDQKLMEILAQRQSLAYKAGEFKKSPSDVYAYDRVKNLLLERQEQALVLNLDQGLVNNIFKSIITHTQEYQLNQLRSRKKQ